MFLEEQTVKRANQDETQHEQKQRRITRLSFRGWRYAIKRAFNEFNADGCTDLAASLTYFAVLSIFPALLAIVSLLGVFGQGEETTQAILKFISDFAPEDVLSLVEEPITQLTSSPSAGFALLTGVVGALWTASGYVGAFGRALNKIYDVSEGRPIWVLRPWNLMITALLVFVVVLIMLVLLLGGSVLELIDRAIPALEIASFAAIWLWLRWPVILLLAVLLVGLLYYGTPNVKQPRIRWLSPGAVMALLLMGLAGLGFTFYVSNFGNYNATYGTIGGVIVLLLFIWIMNNILLFGAQLNAQIERSRQLEAGIKAETTIQLPPRSDTQAQKQLEKKAKLVEQGRELRIESEEAESTKETSR